jgi:hypothetical protein
VTRPSACSRSARARWPRASRSCRAPITEVRRAGKRDETEAGYRLAHLRPFFTGRRAVEIRQALVTEYVARRQTEKASNGTINRELAVLARMLNLAYENDKLARVPTLKKLEEAGAR